MDWGGGAVPLCVCECVCGEGMTPPQRHGPGSLLSVTKGGFWGSPPPVSYFILVFFFFLLFIKPQNSFFFLALPHFPSISGEAAPLPSPQPWGGHNTPQHSPCPRYPQFAPPIHAVYISWVDGGVDAPPPGWGCGDRVGARAGVQVWAPPFFLSRHKHQQSHAPPQNKAPSAIGGTTETPTVLGGGTRFVPPILSLERSWAGGQDLGRPREMGGEQRVGGGALI